MFIINTKSQCFITRTWFNIFQKDFLKKIVKYGKILVTVAQG